MNYTIHVTDNNEAKDPTAKTFGFKNYRFSASIEKSEGGYLSVEGHGNSLKECVIDLVVKL
jgi:hypothetical protein